MNAGSSLDLVLGKMRFSFNNCHFLHERLRWGRREGVLEISLRTVGEWTRKCSQNCGPAGVFGRNLFPGCKQRDQISKYPYRELEKTLEKTAPLSFLYAQWVASLEGSVLIPFHPKWRRACLQGAVGGEVSQTILQPFPNQVLIV